MSKFYTNLTPHESGAIEGIQSNGSEYGISISQDIDAAEVKASDGFTSGTGSPVQISVSGTNLTFTVVGVGSSTLILTP